MALRIKEAAGGLVIEVRASAGASRDGIRGEIDGRLKVAVTAPPEKGKANSAIREMLAERLRVRRADVELLIGRTGRDKAFLVKGLGISDVRERLAPGGGP